MSVLNKFCSMLMVAAVPLVLTLSATSVQDIALVAQPSATVSPNTAAPFSACNVELDLGTRKVYRFKNQAGQKLNFGKVKVTATADHPNRYCVQLRLGGRTPYGSEARAFYDLNEHGRCRYMGGQGSESADRLRDKSYTLKVERRTCQAWFFIIERRNVEYVANFRRANKPS